MRLAEYISSESERLGKAYAAGVETAFHEAAVLCISNGAPLPEWAVERAVQMINLDLFSRPLDSPRERSPAERELADAQAGNIYRLMTHAIGQIEELGFVVLFPDVKPERPNGAVSAAVRAVKLLMESAGKKHLTEAAIRQSYYRVKRAVKEGKGARFGLNP